MIRPMNAQDSDEEIEDDNDTEEQASTKETKDDQAEAKVVSEKDTLQTMKRKRKKEMSGVITPFFDSVNFSVLAMTQIW